MDKKNLRLDYIRGNGTGDLVNNFRHTAALTIFIALVDSVVYLEEIKNMSLF